MRPDIATLLAEVRALHTKVDAALARQATATPTLVLTRKDAARELRVSLAQLYRLIAAGRLVALPSGIARTELERYARAPQTKLRANATRGKRERSAADEAARLRDMLKAQRRPRGVI